MTKHTRRPKRVTISADARTDEDGSVWLEIGSGPIVEALIERFTDAFPDAQAKLVGNDWRIRSAALERDGYHHLRIGVFAERI